MGTVGTERRSSIVRHVALSSAILLLPVAVTLFDWLARRDSAAWSSGDRPDVAAVLSCLLLWSGLTVAAAGRRKRWSLPVLLSGAGLASLAIGSQVYVMLRFGGYFTVETVANHHSAYPLTGGPPLASRLLVLLSYGLPALLFVLGVFLARAAIRVGARGALLGAALFLAGASLGGAHSVKRALPDGLYFASLAAEIRESHAAGETDRGRAEITRPGQHARITLPGTRPSRSNNVLWVVTESVRAASACSRYEPTCTKTPHTNSLFPQRYGFSSMRALASTTALSLGVLLTGQPVDAARREILMAPRVWDYAKAAGYDTAFYTSQSLLFGEAARWIDSIAARRFIAGPTLDGNATIELGADDQKLLAYAEKDLAELREPFFALVQLSNTHFPYRDDPRDAPHSRKDRAAGRPHRSALLNRYEDAVYRQDRELAAVLRAFRATTKGGRTTIVFVSDHGEHVEERGLVGHTWTLFDEEIRVPFWIDPAPAALDEREKHALVALAEMPLTQLDILPTVLDLLGVLDAPEFRRHVSAMPGTSLLRGGTNPARPVTLSNCGSIHSCSQVNVGAILGSRKLQKRGVEEAECFDTSSDPHEVLDLGLDACSELVPTLLRAEKEAKVTPARRP